MQSEVSEAPRRPSYGQYRWVNTHPGRPGFKVSKAEEPVLSLRVESRSSSLLPVEPSDPRVVELARAYVMDATTYYQ